LLRRNFRSLIHTRPRGPCSRCAWRLGRPNDVDGQFHVVARGNQQVAFDDRTSRHADTSGGMAWTTLTFAFLDTRPAISVGLRFLGRRLFR
jgi:hypothetical protein